MAIENRGTNLPGVVAAVDLSSYQHHFITIDSSGQADLSVAGARVDAVVENNPVAGGAVSLMGPGSVAKVVAGGAINAGDPVASDANAEAVVAVTGDFVVGPALNTVTAPGEIVSVWVTMPGVAP